MGQVVLDASALRSRWPERVVDIVASSSPPERSPPETVPQERKHGEDQEHNEKDLGSFPGEGCHACESEEGSDQGDDEEHDSEP
jgi:hypothetical protein